VPALTDDQSYLCSQTQEGAGRKEGRTKREKEGPRVRKKVRRGTENEEGGIERREGGKEGLRERREKKRSGERKRERERSGEREREKSGQRERDFSSPYFTGVTYAFHYPFLLQAHNYVDS